MTSPDFFIRKFSGLKSQIKNWAEVEKYIRESKRKSEIERTSESKEKTGVELEHEVRLIPYLTKDLSSDE